MMTNNLFIGGFPYETTEDELGRIFSACGTVLKVKILTERETGRSRGLAFVEMASHAEAAAAIAKLDGTNVGERKMFVSEAREKGQPPSGPAAKPGFVERRSGKDRRAGGAPSAERRPERKPWEKRPGGGDRPERKPWSKKPGSGPKKWGAAGRGGGNQPGFKKRPFGRGFGKPPR